MITETQRISRMVIPRRVYMYCSNTDNTIWYIGSSTCSIEKLEYNHRNAFKLWPEEKKDQTTFRGALQNKIKDGYFKTVIEKVCTRKDIEDLEGQLIRAFRPKYNFDLDPLRTSMNKNRL